MTSYYVVDMDDPCDPGVCFGDDYEKAREAVRELRAKGVDARIFGGHLGWHFDKGEDQ